MGIARELCYHTTSHALLIPDLFYHAREYLQLLRGEGEGLAEIVQMSRELRAVYSYQQPVDCYLLTQYILNKARVARYRVMVIW